MGNQELRYASPVGEKKDGESHIYRSQIALNQLVNSFYGKTTVQEIFLAQCEKYPKQKLLGTQVQTSEHSRHYVYKTYDQCKEIAEKLGSGMEHLGLVPLINEYNDGKRSYKLKMVAAFSKNREEWLLLEYANILYNNTMIPLYDTLGADGVSFALQQTNLTTIFVSDQSVQTLLKCKDLAQLKTVVTFDDLKQEVIEKVIQTRKIESQASGEGKILPYAQVTQEDIFTFSYTSGTTGNPKGVMLSHLNVASTLSSIGNTGFALVPTDVHLSYLPLAHVFERCIVTGIMGFGGTICFYSGDVMKIKDDLMLCKPTIFVSVPRLYHRLYSAIKDKLDQLTGFKKTLADQALASKLYYLRNGGYVTHRLWDKLVFNKTKEAFGGRVRFMVSASAPISAEILDFLKVVVCCPIVEAYGQTENTGACCLTHINDGVSGHVGGPGNNLEVKLLDVPEMNYFSTDKDALQRSTPRGEICIRGNNVTPGYYKEVEKTKEAIDADGWLHTGDVGMIFPNGSLKIIDRVKNIFKLSQGEYIAPEKVENIYIQVKGVTEAFVYGDSLQAFTVGIIVPDKHEVQRVAQEKGIQGTFEELCINAEINKYFLTKINEKGKEAKLNGMENVKKIYLEPQSFQLHGCTSNSMKLQRHVARQTFKAQIDQMYANQ